MTQAVTRGIDRLLRLDYPQSKSEVDLRNHYGRLADSFEMIDALEYMRTFFEDSADMLGRPMYRGERTFDFIHDIKKYIEAIFLVGEDMKQSALLRRKNRSMVVLMLNPLVDLFQYKTHEETLELYDDIIDNCIQHIVESDIDATPDDAFVVRSVIQKEIARRNKTQATVDGIMRLRRRKKKRKAKKK